MKFVHALNSAPGLGALRVKALLDHFGAAQAAWEAPESALRSVLGPKTTQAFLAHRQVFPIAAAWENLQALDITPLSLQDSAYPVLLRQIPNPPFLLYCRGNRDLLTLPSIAVVGSRKLSTYGDLAARSLSRDLASAGICVISGLAFGIDAAAHQAALEVQGATIAVLGSGVDNPSITPRSNLFLARKILEQNGLILSEFPPGTAPTIGTFPARNRIMAGLASGTLVIEAAEKSGSLITAHHALEFNREIFAVPGPIFSPQSVGTNRLIQNGAKAVLAVGDILNELHWQNHPAKTIPQTTYQAANATEETILNKLSSEPLHVDSLAKLTKLDAASLNASLAILEIKGIIKNIGGQNFIKL